MIIGKYELGYSRRACPRDGDGRPTLCCVPYKAGKNVRNICCWVLSVQLEFFGSIHAQWIKVKKSTFDVITSIVSFLWAYTTAARDVTGERVRTAYDVTAACYHKRRTQRNVFCHTWY